jgi:hypothetical protein
MSAIVAHPYGQSSTLAPNSAERTDLSADRAARLTSLDPEQLLLALSFLLGYLPAAFDAALEAVEPCGEAPQPEMEPYCLVCDAQVGVFSAHGPEYRHFKGVLSAVSKPRPYKADHAPKVAWRPATDIPSLR